MNAGGGGLVSAALRPIEGSAEIARYAVDRARRAASLTILERTVNGQPGLVAQQDGITVTVFAFDLAGDRAQPRQAAALDHGLTRAAPQATAADWQRRQLDQPLGNVARRRRLVPHATAL